MDKKFNQQLDQKLQEGYQQLSAKAPDGLWERVQLHLPEVEVDQQLDDRLEASYKQLKVTAPAGLWANIEQGLSTENIDEQLDGRLEASYKQLAATAPAGLWKTIESALPEAPLDQQLDDKLKEGFAQQSAKTAPIALWSVISEELGTTASLDEQLDEKLKVSFKEDHLRAPHKVWAAVNRQLNIDRTWQKISTALDAPVATIDWKLRTLQGIVLALILLLWLRTCNKVPVVEQREPIAVHTLAAQEQPTKQNTSTPAVNGLNVGEELGQEARTTATTSMGIVSLTAPTAIDQEGTVVNSMDASNNNPNKVSRLGVSPIIKHTVVPSELNRTNEELVEDTDSPQKTSKGASSSVDLSHRNSLLEQPLKGITVVEENTSSEKTPMSTTIITNNALATKTVEAITIPPIVLLPEELELAKEPTWKSKRWTPNNKLAIGVFTAVNSTVLLNNETREGFDYNSLTINYFGLAANYGLWARCRLNKSSALMAEYSINADHRQAYGVYQKGQFAVKEYVFKYNRVSLAYQLDIWQHRRHPNNKVTAQLGAYVGLMRTAQLYYDKVLLNDQVGEYHHYDGGVKVALGHEITIDHFVIGYGIRSDIGLANIFKGNKILDKQQDKTNLIHLGGYIHLGYQF